MSFFQSSILYLFSGDQSIVAVSFLCANSSAMGKKMIQIRDFYVPVYFIYAVAQSLGGARDTPDRGTM